MPEPLSISKLRCGFKSPLTALAAAFASGIVWAHFLRPAVGIHCFLVGAAACILVGLILLREGWDRSAVMLALAGMMLTGIADARQWERRFPLNHVRYFESMGVDLNSPLGLEGEVVSTPFHIGHDLQFDIETRRVVSLGHEHKVTGKIRLRVQGSEGVVASNNRGQLEIEYGDEIQTVAGLHPPHSYQNPGSFDYRRWMEDIEDVYWIGTVKYPEPITRNGHTTSFHSAELAQRTRQRLLRGIDDIYPPWSTEGRYGAVLKAVLWGDRTALDSGTIDDFRRTGLYHLLVIAGLHVGLLALLVESLLRGLRFRRVTRAFLVLGFLGVYACLVEQRAPTLRATLMIGLYLLARVLDRRHSPLNSLGGVALILLYVRPSWLFESGFQLSFAAAFLIVGVAAPLLERTTEPYRRALRRLDDVLLDDRFSPRLAQARLDLRALVYAVRRRVPFLERFPTLSRNIVVGPAKLLVWVVNIIMFSAVLQLGLLLPMVETFHRVTFAGVGLNALAIPLMTLLLALALPINLLSLASPAAAAWPAKFLTLVMTLLFDMTHLPGLAAWLSYRMPTPPLWVAWGFCASFVLAGVALRFAPRLTSAALATCALFVGLVAVQPFAARLPRGILELTALDCGQVDALFLVFSDGTTMLVDAGGSRVQDPQQSSFQSRRWNSGEDIVSPYLWSRGVKRVDVVALTNASSNQFGGLYAIFANFHVGEFWHAPEDETPEYAELLETVAEHRIPTRTLIAGDTLSFADVLVRVLRPGPDSRELAPRLPGTSGRRALQGGGKAISYHKDDSLIMQISSEGINFLLAGQTGRNADKITLAFGKTLESQGFGTDYQQAKSISNRRFMSNVAPSVAILRNELGAAGSEGLLSTDTLRAWQKGGTHVFRTSAQGATTMKWNGEALQIRTYNGAETVIANDGNKSRPAN